jgi:tRNA-splicing ligase RtcB
MMSRSQAKKEIHGDRLRLDLEARGIQIRAGSLPGLAEEDPQAYKDVDRVVETVTGAGIARRSCLIATLRCCKRVVTFTSQIGA